MTRCVFLTLAKKLDFVIDDEEAYAPLSELGIETEAVPWDADVDWSAYDVAVIRSTWDYFHRPREFLAALERIRAAVPHFYNDLELVRWNVEKTYLLDLARKGIDVVPSLLRDHFAAGDLDGLFEELDAEELVLKPAIGASALDAFRVRRGADEAPIAAAFDRRRFLVQRFVPEIFGGEVSLMYFDGVFSHAVKKTPKPGDFRSQEEHGGAIDSIVPDDDLKACGDRVVAGAGETLYARADFVRVGDRHLLMELELVEPSMYLRMDPEAPGRLARAISARVRGRRS